MARKPPDKRNPNAKLEQQMVEVTALFTRWMEAKKPVALHISTMAVSLMVVGVFDSVPERRDVFFFVSRQGGLGSLIAPCIYHSARIEKPDSRGQFEVRLERFGESLSVMLLEDSGDDIASVLLATSVSHTIN